MPKLLIATTNQGKFAETHRFLSQVESLELLSVDDFPKLGKLKIVESGQTFTENALLKAVAYGQQSQILTLAEDAGLEVFSLNGRPGVNSARYGQNKKDRNQKLLAELTNQTNRTARFTSVFALFDPLHPDEPTFFKGEVLGKIAFDEKGEIGFDYDYVFIPEGYEQTYAQLGKDKKREISHRTKALKKLKAYFEKS